MIMWTWAAYLVFSLQWDPVVMGFSCFLAVPILIGSLLQYTSLSCYYGGEGMTSNPSLFHANHESYYPIEYRWNIRDAPQLLLVSCQHCKIWFILQSSVNGLLPHNTNIVKMTSLGKVQPIVHKCACPNDLRLKIKILFFVDHETTVIYIQYYLG